ncbi:hypothetical protein AVEN_140830-1 [Araneus ventricosus]|uniref:RNase H type-1 domain-containing protein n=1 Tax=Araneus ventricosus TaxID=182803 RepID=A0A4Y2FP46_ARAVE|nr:hypothetical protein AVEN_140830-1 [Araneus ventricosus]
MVEFVAIRKAVKYIIGRQLRQAKIISDSRSALMSLASVHERQVIINEIKDNIKGYLGDIQLIWIRAHRGFGGNERADQLAKMASTKDHVDFSFCPSSIQIKNAARREILEAWQQYWSGSSNARWIYALLSKVAYKRMFGDFFFKSRIKFLRTMAFSLVIRLACLPRIPHARVEEPTVLFFMCSLSIRS